MFIVLSEKKFLIGIILIISNFIVGKIAIPIFAIHKAIGVFVYLFSWLMLFVGLYLSGREGWYYSKFYYKQYKKNLRMKIKENAEKVKTLKINNKSK